MVRNQSLHKLGKHTELPKIRRSSPTISPIIGTINTVHYIITTCLTNLLFRLIENNFTILTLILTKLRLNPVKYLTKVTNLLALTPHRYLLPFV